MIEHLHYIVLIFTTAYDFIELKNFFVHITRRISRSRTNNIANKINNIHCNLSSSFSNVNFYGHDECCFSRTDILQVWYTFSQISKMIPWGKMTPTSKTGGKLFYVYLLEELTFMTYCNVANTWHFLPFGRYFDYCRYADHYAAIICLFVILEPSIIIWFSRFTAI